MGILGPALEALRNMWRPRGRSRHLQHSGSHARAGEHAAAQRRKARDAHNKAHPLPTSRQRREAQKVDQALAGAVAAWKKQQSRHTIHAGQGPTQPPTE